VTDDCSKAFCSCRETFWFIPRTEKIYKKKVKCPHCGAVWILKRYPSGRARVLRYNRGHEGGDSEGV
jgi:ribosomal protein S27AE